MCLLQYTHTRRVRGWLLPVSALHCQLISSSSSNIGIYISVYEQGHCCCYSYNCCYNCRLPSTAAVTRILSTSVMGVGGGVRFWGCPLRQGRRATSVWVVRRKMAAGSYGIAVRRRCREALPVRRVGNPEPDPPQPPEYSCLPGAAAVLVVYEEYAMMHILCCRRESRESARRCTGAYTRGIRKHSSDLTTRN